jgi:hypothetical protein
VKSKDIKFDAVEAVKARADQHAAKECIAIRSLVKINPMFAMVQPNFKFFRRLAGLRNGDAQRT